MYNFGNKCIFIVIVIVIVTTEGVKNLWAELIFQVFLKSKVVRRV